MSDPGPEFFRAAIFEIIENQMREGAPPETKQTYDRLLAEGHSHGESMKLIGRVVTSEVYGTLKDSQEFDEQRFVAALNALPVCGKGVRNQLPTTANNGPSGASHN